MIKITVNGVEYKLSTDKLQMLLAWLQQNGAVGVVESTNPDINGRSIINE